MALFLIICLLSPLLATADDTKSAEPTSAPLTCMVTDETTNSTTSKPCSVDEDACVSLRDWSTLNGAQNNNHSYQTCGKKDSCPTSFSITIAKGETLSLSSVCCTTANCNSATIVPDNPAADFPNRFVCPIGCFTSTELECKSSKVNCTGAENKCIDLTVMPNNGNDTVILKGCGTQSACKLKTNSTLFLSGKSYTVMNAEECQDAKSSSPSILSHYLGRGVFPLLLPGLFSILLAKFMY